jgi:hypothetical protein
MTILTIPHLTCLYKPMRMKMRRKRNSVRRNLKKSLKKPKSKMGEPLFQRKCMADSIRKKSIFP